MAQQRDEGGAAHHDEQVHSSIAFRHGGIGETTRDGVDVLCSRR